MISAPLPAREAERLEALRRYRILDTLSEQVFDDLTLMAAQICDTPMALVSLIDSERQWFKSRVGLDATQTPRDVAFCAHAILQPEELFVVPDALEDPRFADNPLVQGHPEIRFYAGMPLVDPEGFALGTLCTLDRRPREIRPDQRAALETLARQVMAHLQLREHTQRLRENEARFRATLESLSEGVLLRDEFGGLASYNASAERILGVALEPFLGQRDFGEALLLHQEGGQELPGALTEGVGGTRQVLGLQRPDGATTWCAFDSRPLIFEGSAQPQGMVISFRDVSEEKALRDRLRHDATRDGLTGLANRRHFSERLQAAAESARRHKHPLSLGLCDLDRFKGINDRHGHAGGDAALKALSQVLLEELRVEDLPARFGGDEFCVLFPYTPAEGALALAERVRQRVAALRLPELEGSALSISMGLADWTPEMKGPEDLLAAADRALYRAKAEGRDRVTLAS